MPRCYGWRSLRDGQGRTSLADNEGSTALRRATVVAGLGALAVAGVAAGLACGGGPGSAPVVLADDIPVAHTPDGGWRGEMPPPVLAGCTEPLAEGAPDLRGTWRAVSVERDGQPLPDHPLAEHVERIEQCGNRVVVTAEPVIHDMRADGTLENGVNDVAAANFAPIQVAAVFHEGRLDLHPFGIDPQRPPLVTREVVDGELIWDYAGTRVVLRRVDGEDAASG